MINRIRAIRKEKGMTLADLAEACDPPTTPQTVGRIETGMRTLSTKWMDRMAKALGVEPELLVRGEATEATQVVATLGERGPEALAKPRDALPPTAMGGAGNLMVLAIDYPPRRIPPRRPAMAARSPPRRRRPRRQPRRARPAQERPLRLRPPDRQEWRQDRRPAPRAWREAAGCRSARVDRGGGDAGSEAVGLRPSHTAPFWDKFWKNVANQLKNKCELG